MHMGTRIPTHLHMWAHACTHVCTQLHMQIHKHTQNHTRTTSRTKQAPSVMNSSSRELQAKKDMLALGIFFCSRNLKVIKKAADGNSPVAFSPLVPHLCNSRERAQRSSSYNTSSQVS